MIKINNIAELKQRKGISNSNISLLGYYSVGDGGGGEFYWDDASTETDNGGTVIQVTGVTTGRWKRNINSPITTKKFGAKADNIQDDTVFIQKAINYKCSTGGELFFDNGTYKITDTITIANTFGITLRGSSSQECIIYFNNTTSNKELFFFAPNSTYCNIEDMFLIDVNAGTSVAIKTQDQLNIVDDRPNWKSEFHRTRVANFLIGYLATTDTTLSGANHAFLDGVSFYHCKFRNCRTAYKNQNTQAVNINFFNTDIENDDSGEQYTMIRDESGFTLNVFGGSFIGKGRVYDGYYDTSATNLFQNGFVVFNGVRFEIRSGSIGDIFRIPKRFPIIQLTISLKNCNFLMNSQDLNFCDYTGKVCFEIDNCDVLNGSLVINQYATSGFSGVDSSGFLASYGSISINNSKGFKYIRNEGSAYGTFQRNHATKVTIKGTKLSPDSQFSIDSKDFLSLNNPELSQRGAGLNYVNTNYIIYNSENHFIGFKSVKIKMPYYGTPISLVVFKQPISFSNADVVKLYLVKDVANWATSTFNVSTDAILLADSTSLLGKCGFIEIPISMTNNYLQGGFLFQSGFGSWLEGRMYIEHSGYSGNLSGFVGVKYV